MWSCYLFLGCHFGVEWYEDIKYQENAAEEYIGTNYKYFIIDLGCLRIQKCEPIND
tara:strand:- start:125 stop:292 length:168 start_codon:yes stop_codon:yes gene_type:complete